MGQTNANVRWFSELGMADLEQVGQERDLTRVGGAQPADPVGERPQRVVLGSHPTDRRFDELVQRFLGDGHRTL